MLPIMRQVLLTKKSDTPPAVVTRGLIRWYKFDEGAGQVLTDYSGNEQHGQLGSSSGTDNQDPTWVDGGLSFDGGDQIIIPGQSLPGAFTVISVNAPAHLVNNYYMGSTLGNVRQGYSSSGQYYMRSVPSGASDAFFESDLAVDVPRCVTFQRLDDDTVFCMENDGTPVVRTEQPGTANWEYIGRSPIYYFSGKIYYTLIYNVALTLEEISQVYRFLQAEMAARGVIV
jgi:hypothetical protein